MQETSEQITHFTKPEHFVRKGTARLTFIFVFVGFLFFTGIAYSDTTTGLQGWWKMDQASSGTCSTTTTDSSGIGNTGTCVGSPTYVAGYIGTGALNLNGSSQYVNAGNNSSVQITGNITLSAWVKPTTLPSGINQYRGIIVKGYDGTNTGYQLDFQDDASTGNVPALMFGSYSAVSHSHGVQYNLSGNIVANRWYLITGTYDGTTWRIWVNGVDVADSTDSFGPQSSAKSLLIGAADFGTTVYLFDGIIDDVRIYNRALTSSDMSALYALAPVDVTISSGTLGPQTISGTFTGGATIASSSALTVTFPGAFNTNTNAALSLTKGSTSSIVKYVIGSQPTSDSGYTNTYSSGSTTMTVADNDVIWLLVTSPDLSTKLYYKITVTVSPQTWIVAKQYNPLNQGNNTCDTGGLFVSVGGTPFAIGPLNNGNSVYTPACLRDPYIRLYFGTYYMLYSEGFTYLDIASSSSLTSGWTLINHISIGSAARFGVNVPQFVVDPSGIVHVTVWDYPANAWWEIHPSSSNPSTWGSSWSTRGNLYDTTNTILPGVENIYMTQYNDTYYLLQSGSNTLQLRTSNNVTTGWSAASANLSIPNFPSFAEGEVPIFIGGNLAVSWAYDDNATHYTPLTYSINSSGSSGSWGTPIQVSPANDSYAQTVPLTDMACGTAAQYYQVSSATAPSSNLCAIGTASTVTQVGTNWVWTCTLSSNVASCSALSSLPSSYIPTVTTNAQSSVTTSTATLNATISSNGGTTITDAGFAVGLSSNLTSATATTSVGAPTGVFSLATSSLTANTTYYFRAYATNSAGTSYGSITSFATSPLTAPSLTVQSASSISQTTAVLNGTVTATGGATVRTEGFTYGSDVSYGSTALSTGSFSTGAFTQAISGLTCGVTYHYEALAANSVSTTTSSDTTFTTTSCTSASVSSLGLGGSVVGLIGGAGGTYRGIGYIAPRPQIVYPDGTIVYLDTPPHTTTTSDTAATAGAVVTSTFSTFNRNLTFGSEGSDVLALQTFLIHKGYLSVGNITGHFGPLTLRAVKKFQTKYKVVSQNSSSYGYVGPKTRALLNGMLEQ